MNKISKLAPPKLLDDERKEILSQLIPESVEDGKINVQKIKESLGEFAEDESLNEHFELSWPGKREAKKVTITSSKGTLVPAPGEGVDEDKTKNLFIEGENLEVLKLLHKSYIGKIKMIYIDPPYNTGKDFVYSDKFSDSIEEYRRVTGQVDSENREMETNKKSDGRFHSRWLSMMYPRLKLAKDLLVEDGVIFISIDDNEIHNLKLICNEIFGEEGFIAQIIVENDSRARQYGAIATTHEYILVYSKDQEYRHNILSKKDKTFQYEDKDGGFDIYELRNRNIAFNISNRPNLYYPFWVDPNSADKDQFYRVSLDDINGWVKTYPQESQDIKTVWRWGKEKAKKNIGTHLFARKKGDGSFQIVKKYRGNTFVYNSVWVDKNIKTDKGTLEIKALFDNKKVFDFPKPVELIKRTLNIFSEKNSIILDFFAGSGTTAHSVMQLNSEDNGNRQFIMVQTPEITTEDSEAFKAGYKNIAEIAKERIRRAGKKIKEETKKEIDYGFKVFKLQKSNYRDQDEILRSGQQSLDFVDLTNPLVKDWKPEDLITEVTLLEGFPLDSKIEHLLSIQTNKIQVVSCDNPDKTYKLFVCLDEKIDSKTISNLTFEDEDKFICLDSAISDTDKLTLSDKAHLKVI